MTFSITLFSGCLASSTAPQIRQEIIVTRDSNSFLENCSPLQVAQLVTRFLDAFNRGDQQQLREIFALGGGWYSVSEGSQYSEERNQFVAYDIDTLLTYFAERHQQEEQQRLIQIDVSEASWHGGVDIALSLARKADDLDPGTVSSERIAQGKGAINCQAQKIKVWSVGTLMPDPPPGLIFILCPLPPADVSENAVIACARGP